MWLPETQFAGQFKPAHAPGNAASARVEADEDHKLGMGRGRGCLWGLRGRWRVERYYVVMCSICRCEIVCRGSITCHHCVACRHCIAWRCCSGFCSQVHREVSARQAPHRLWVLFCYWSGYCGLPFLFIPLLSVRKCCLVGTGALN
jgi:hypothetical protein